METFMIREMKKEDLADLLKLYTMLHNNTMPEMTQELDSLWDSILQDKNHHIIVALVDNKIVSSCVCVIIPNLTNGQRPYALVENVITEESFRGQGIATACLAYAREVAEDNNCYKIMLLTGSKKESTLQFYERAGYNRNDKTAFIQWLK